MTLLALGCELVRGNGCKLVRVLQRHHQTLLTVKSYFQLFHHQLQSLGCQVRKAIHKVMARSNRMLQMFPFV